MKKVINNLKLLKVLTNCNKKIFKGIIQNSDKELICCICECVLNCINGNVKLGDDEKRKLKKYKNSLRKLLSKKEKSIKIKKKIIVQHGSGFLPLLIPAILTALTSFLQ